MSSDSRLSFVGRVVAVSGLLPVAIGLASLMGQTACETRSGSDAALLQERDSAGVRIVEYGRRLRSGPG